MVRFDKKYAVFFLGLLIVEILIAIFTKGDFRGMVGDLLVVGLVYCFIQTFFAFNKLWTIIGVWIFAVIVEIAQAFQYVEKLGLQDSKFFSTVLGTQFDSNDIWAYTAGCILIYFLEFYDDNSKPRKRIKRLF